MRYKSVAVLAALAAVSVALIVALEFSAEPAIRRAPRRLLACGVVHEDKIPPLVDQMSITRLVQTCETEMVVRQKVPANGPTEGTQRGPSLTLRPVTPRSAGSIPSARTKPRARHMAMPRGRSSRDPDAGQDLNLRPWD